MADKQFHVVFKGELLKGASAEQVKNNLAKLFKTEPAKLDHLFAGKPVIIKKDLDRAGADKYEAVLRRAGAVIHLVEAKAADTAAAKAPEVIPPRRAERPPTGPRRGRAAAGAARVGTMREADPARSPTRRGRGFAGAAREPRRRPPGGAAAGSPGMRRRGGRPEPRGPSRGGRRGPAADSAWQHRSGPPARLDRAGA
ncbi:MAG: hypothetical protein AAF387_17970, partial [Pseudomonadota bacterium]